MPGTTLYQSIPTEAVERHEKLIVQKLSEMAAKNMTVGGQDGSIFKFGFWGQGAMMRRAELIEEESDEVPIDSAEAISNGGLPWGEGEGPNKGWLGSNMGTLRSKQIGMLHLINKAAFEAGSGGTDKGDGPPAQLALPAP